jgi:hypothetical protein
MNTEIRRQHILNAIEAGFKTSRAIAKRIGMDLYDIKNDFPALERLGKIRREAKVSSCYVWGLVI